MSTRSVKVAACLLALGMIATFVMLPSSTDVDGNAEELWAASTPDYSAQRSEGKFVVQMQNLVIQTVNATNTTTNATEPAPTPADPALAFAAVSAQSYVLTFDIDCNSIDANGIVALIAQHTGWSPNNILVVSTSCGSVTLNFKCRAASVAEADAACADIVKQANDPNSALFAALRTVVPGQSGSGTRSTGGSSGDDDSSKKGLFGLFALLLIPIIIVAVVLFLKRPKEDPYMAGEEYEMKAQPEAYPVYGQTAPNTTPTGAGSYGYSIPAPSAYPQAGPGYYPPYAS